jgi:hypothetical protein
MEMLGCLLSQNGFLLLWDLLSSQADSYLCFGKTGYCANWYLGVFAVRLGELNKTDHQK